MSTPSRRIADCCRVLRSLPLKTGRRLIVLAGGGLADQARDWFAAGLPPSCTGNAGRPCPPLRVYLDFLDRSGGSVLGQKQEPKSRRRQSARLSPSSRPGQFRHRLQHHL